MLRWRQILLAMTFVGAMTASATALSPIEAEIERLYTVHADSDENAELEPIKALEPQALAGSMRDQRAFWYALCVMQVGNENLPDAERAATALIDLTREHADQSLQSDSLVCQSSLANLKQDSAESLALSKKAFEVAKANGDAFAKFRAGIVLGGNSSRQGMLEQAISAYQLALNAAEQLQDVSRQTRVQNNLGWVEFQFGQADAALASFTAAEKNASEHNLQREYVDSLNNKAIVLSELGRLGEAKQIYLRVLDYGEKSHSISWVLTAYINLADTSLRQKNYVEAERMALIGLQRVPEGKLIDSMLTLRFNLAIALAGQKQLKRARPIFDEVIDYYQKNNFKSDEQILWQEWSQALQENEEYKDALTAYQNFKRISDELNSKDREKAVLRLQQQFEAEKRAKEIELLTKTNNLKDIELVNNQLEKRVRGLLALLFGALLVVLAMFFKRVRAANLQLAEKNRELDYQSTRDPLTALYNRRYFQQLINSVDLSQAERRSAAVGDDFTRAIYLLDIDHFKRINDKHGHAAGDAVLRVMAERLREGLRDNDVIVRWGGEEFLIFAQQLPMHMVQPLAQRILDLFALEAVPFEDKKIQVSCSVGYSLLPLKLADDQVIGWERAVNVVDMALYLAKAHGRNRAYGITALNGKDENSLTSIERDLESAWQNGVVDMQITLGPEYDKPNNPNAFVHQ